MIGRHFPSLYSLPLIDSGKYPIISTFFTFALFSSWKTKGIMRGNHVKDIIFELSESACLNNFTIV